MAIRTKTGACNAAAGLRHHQGSGEIEETPFENLPEKNGRRRMDADKMKTVRWMKPKIVAEIAFNERTEAGRLRHSKFLRLRDKADLRKRDTSRIR